MGFVQWSQHLGLLQVGLPESPANHRNIRSSFVLFHYDYCDPITFLIGLSFVSFSPDSDTGTESASDRAPFLLPSVKWFGKYSYLGSYIILDIHSSFQMQSNMFTCSLDQVFPRSLAAIMHFE
jgi:hypothetical protein